MRVIGIDPGASGAIVLLRDEPNAIVIERCIDMPTFTVRVGRANKSRVSAAGLAAALRGMFADAVVCEEVHAMPGQGVSSMFAFGEALGIIKGACAGLGLPLHLVAPQEWQRATRTRGGKDGARARASELYPTEAHLFARVKDDGRADAALIATYALIEGFGRQRAITVKDLL